MTSWIKVITHPLGLAGFALFLVFSLIARKGTKKQPLWVWGTAVAMAAVSLVGGLLIAYRKTATVHEAPHGPQMTIGSIKQSSTGAGACNVAGVQGEVTTNCNSPANNAPRADNTSSKEKPTGK